MSKYRIIACDGGPSAVTYVRYLQEIENVVPGFLHKTELFAGTSSGAILALYFALNLDKARMSVCSLHGSGVECSCELICGAISLLDDMLDSLTPHWWEYVRLIAGYTAMYKNAKRLREVLHKYYGPARMEQLSRKALAVSYRVGRRLDNRYGPKIFSSYDPKDRQEKLEDVALRSGAFPIAMPIIDGHIDGGIFANNPGMCAITEYYSLQKRSGTDELDRDILMLSLGGDDAQFGGSWIAQSLQKSEAHWGWLPWLLNLRHPLLLLSVAMNSDQHSVSYQCKQILKSQHFLRLSDFGEQDLINGVFDIMFGRKQKLKELAERQIQAWLRQGDEVGSGRGANREQVAEEATETMGYDVQIVPSAVIRRASYCETLRWAKQMWMADDRETKAEGS